MDFAQMFEPFADHPALIVASQKDVRLGQFWYGPSLFIRKMASVLPAQAFQEMSDFFEEMLDSLAQFGGQSFGDPAFEHLREMGGIPVMTREFAGDGSVESEASLKSASNHSFQPADFEPPKGYKKQDLFKGKKRKKK